MQTVSLRAWRRLGALSFLSALALLLLPVRAHAGLIPGVPDIVYDPVNYASAIARYAQLVQQTRGQVRQIGYAYDELRHVRDQARGWTKFRLSDFGSVFRNVSRTMGSGVSLGYGNPELGELFRRQFPRVPRMIDGVPIPRADQVNSVRDLAYAAVMSSQMQGKQVDLAQTALSALRQNVVGATTERQLQQAQAAIQSFQAEQDLLTRHTLLALNQQLAASNAREAQRQADEEVRAATADGRWRAWEEAVAGANRESASGQTRSRDEIHRRAGRVTLHAAEPPM